MHVGVKEQAVEETRSRHEEGDDRKRGSHRCATPLSCSVYSFSIQIGQGATRARPDLMTSEAGEP